MLKQILCKQILLFGEVHIIDFSDHKVNKEIVTMLREQMKLRLKHSVFVDIIPRENGGNEVTFVFLIDEFLGNTIDHYIEEDLTTLVTGEHQEDFVLPYPIINLNRKRRHLFDESFFGKLWEKNSVELGGDPFVIDFIRYTGNGMYIKVKFT